MFKIKGDQLRAQQLVELLRAAAVPGLVLQSGYVRLDGDTSDRLGACLREIIASDRAAQVDVNYTLPLGHFRDWQGLNVPDAVRINADAQGMGVAIAIHEIWENYISRTGTGKLGRYGPAHAAALLVEAEVAKELSGNEGSRVAAVQIGDGKAASFVLDYEQYFLMLNRREPDDDPAQFSAAVKERRHVETIDIEGVAAGVRVDPGLVDTVITKLNKRPAATAQVTGLLADDQDAEPARGRAQAVRSAIIVALDADGYASDDGILLDEVDSRGEGADLGARRAWTSAAAGVDGASTVRVEIWEPET